MPLTLPMKVGRLFFCLGLARGWLPRSQSCQIMRSYQYRDARGIPRRQSLNKGIGHYRCGDIFEYDSQYKKEEVGAFFLSCLGRQQASRRRDKFIPMKKKNQMLASGKIVRANPRAGKKARIEMTVPFFHITLFSLRCTKKALEGRQQKKSYSGRSRNPPHMGHLQRGVALAYSKE